MCRRTGTILLPSCIKFNRAGVSNLLVTVIVIADRYLERGSTMAQMDRDCLFIDWAESALADLRAYFINVP